MTVPRPPDRDGAQVDALVADRYLEALLAAERHADDTPADPALDPGLREAARVLRRSLVRVHPSFRFEERLAARLAGLAAAQAPAIAASGGVVLPFTAATVRPGATELADPLLETILAGDLDPSDEAAVERALPGGPDRRPLLVGGAALTSAAISIVGVAFVAWRATRPGSRNGSRTAAQIARAGLAAVLPGPGLTGGPA